MYDAGQKMLHVVPVYKMMGSSALSTGTGTK